MGEQQNYTDDEESRQNQQRLDELLNQIDKNRGVSPSQEVETIGGEEPNSFSEEHGDVEGDDLPPGDEVQQESTMNYYEGRNVYELSVNQFCGTKAGPSLYVEFHTRRILILCIIIV